MSSNTAQPAGGRDDTFAIQTHQLTRIFSGLVAVDGIELNIKKGEL